MLIFVAYPLIPAAYQTTLFGRAFHGLGVLNQCLLGGIAKA